MILLLIKLASRLAYPLGLSVGLLLLGLALLLLRRRRSAIAAIGVGVGLLAVCSMPVTEYAVVRSLEAGYRQSDPLPRCSTIVLLCGGEAPGLPPRLYPEISDAGDRIMHAARLQRAGLAPRIVVTGGVIEFMHQSPQSSAEDAAYLLVHSLCVDSSAVIVETQAKTTAQHAPLVARIIDSLALPREIILVTSAAHMRRAAGVFRKQGFVVHPAAADFLEDDRFQMTAFQCIPSAQALARVTAAVHEYYGMIAYRLTGKM